MQLHGASDLDQRCLKKRKSSDVLFHQKSSPLPPKSHFGEPFNAKLIMQIALRKSHVNGATKVKLYSYIGIGKYLRVCQNFSARGVRGAQGPLI